MQITSSKLLSIREYAKEQHLGLTEVLDQFNAGSLSFAIQRSTFVPHSFYKAVELNHVGDLSDKQFELPEYLYFNVEDNEWLRITEGEDNIVVENFFMLDSGKSYVVFMGDAYCSNSFSFSDFRVLDEKRLGATEGAILSVSAGESIPVAKTRNSYLRIIGALSEALIGGLSDKHQKNADAVLAALDEIYNRELGKLDKSSQAGYVFAPPIKTDALQTYFKEYADLDYKYLDFKG